MEAYSYDFAFGNLVFTKGFFKCPVCKGLTPNQRRLKHGERIVCAFCESVFKKDVSEYFGGVTHGARFVEYGPKFHICFKWKIG